MIGEALALDGGKPAVRLAPPHFEWPPIDDRTVEAVKRQLFDTISVYDRSGVIARVEDRIKAAIGVEHALLTNSGSAALHTMYVACDLGPGDEVICPAHTFFATVSPMLFTGAVPVFVDIGPDGNIDPAAVESAISPRTKAIVVTHMWGLPCDMNRLVQIAQKYQLILLEDTSHAFGAKYRGRPVGSFGKAAAQSLQGQKPLTGGEGGVLLTNDPELYYRGVALGHFNARCKQEIPDGHQLKEFAVTGMGLKLRIHAVAAAIVEQQLDVIEECIAGRDRVAHRMANALGKLPGVVPILPGSGSTSSWYSLVLRLTDDVLSEVTIERIHAALMAEGAAEVQRPSDSFLLPLLPLFQRPGTLFPVYRDMKMPAGEYPSATSFHNSVLRLPVWHRAEDEEIVGQYLEAFHKVWRIMVPGRW